MWPLWKGPLTSQGVVIYRLRITVLSWNRENIYYQILHWRFVDDQKHVMSLEDRDFKEFNTTTLLLEWPESKPLNTPKACCCVKSGKPSSVGENGKLIQQVWMTFLKFLTETHSCHTSYVPWCLLKWIKIFHTYK